jgi:hypothetical protein
MMLYRDKKVVGVFVRFRAAKSAIQLRSLIVAPATAGSGAYAYTSDDYSALLK